MAHSNFAQSVAFTFLCLGFVSCSFPEPMKRDIPQSSSFYIDSVSAEFISIQSHATFSVPTSRQLQTKVCLKDNRNSQPVISHEFEVQFLTTSQKIKTDLTGCLIYTEAINYNSFAQAREVIWEQRLVAQGFEKGSQKVRLMINPWSGQTLDLTKTEGDPAHYVSATMAVAALQGENQGQMPLGFDGFRITIRPESIQGSTRNVHFEVNGKLYYEAQDSNDQKTNISLSRGKFNLQYTLFFESDFQSRTSRRIIHQSPTIQIPELQQGSLFATDRFILSGGSICASGTVYLGVTVTPIDHAPLNLKKSEAIFYYGNCESRGTQFGTLLAPFQTKIQDNPRYTIADYLAEAAPIQLPPVQDLLESQNIRPARPVQESQSIEIRPLEISTLSYDQAGGVERRRNIQVQACLKSGWDRSPLKNAEIEIDTFQGQKKLASTNDEGCLRFEDQIKFQYFSQECWTVKS
ncbi:MAG: hypothetical protein ACK5WZ_00340, partial [Pseudobdellovibrionaceae bacterium]